MVQIGDTIVSLDVLRECFCCDLTACHGECCVEGDAGAPLTLQEVDEIERVLPTIWDDLTSEAQQVIKEQGICYTDPTGDLVTSIVNGRDCVFCHHDSKGCTYCAIERACREGRISFLKPISCHLYPIRVSNYGVYRALNYHRWDVCRVAILKGEKEKLPVYRFLREPLTRCFGKEWYEELELVATEMKKQHLL